VCLYFLFLVAVIIKYFFNAVQVLKKKRKKKSYNWWIKEVGKLINDVLIYKLQAIEGARIQGASKIIGIDKNERKRIKGKAFGMTDFINPDECDKSIFELIKEITDGMGVDYCFECTGVAPLINQALLATKKVCLSTQIFKLEFVSSRNFVV
jgi:hypothetical protein